MRGPSGWDENSTMNCSSLYRRLPVLVPANTATDRSRGIQRKNFVYFVFYFIILETQSGTHVRGSCVDWPVPPLFGRLTVVPNSHTVLELFITFTVTTVPVNQAVTLNVDWLFA